ncbi:hypothetical protein UY3_17173 [Chelonia mydas]|uniref:Uncharacterized protein n=1 Tax=Chelonia mydas TaxID=8469 RepID=M7BC20_CHEMY|nr:hypothetical protein UY3_17173 [Chelonia mydas]
MGQLTHIVEKQLWTTVRNRSLGHTGGAAADDGEEPIPCIRKRGLHIGKFTKAQLIVRLEDDDRSKEQIPDPKWGYKRIWEQLER